MILKDQNTRNHSAGTIGNGDSCTGCVSHTGYLAYGNSKHEARGRSRHKNNGTALINWEERNVGTKEESPKQVLTSAKDLSIELTEGRESPYRRLD